MNLIDLLVAVFALLLALRGMRRGLAREGLEACSVVIGVAVAYRLHGELAFVVSGNLGLSPALTRPTALFLTAFAVTAIGFGASRLIARAVPADGMAASVNRGGGFVFGALKSLVYSSLLLGLAAQAPAALVLEWLEGSLLGRSIHAWLPNLARHVSFMLE